MNRKETSLLVENWKKFLNESTESRVLEMIDVVANNNHKIKIIDKGDEVTVAYVDSEGKVSRYKKPEGFDEDKSLNNTGKIYGSVSCLSNERLNRYTKKDISKKLLAIGEGEKNSCWHISLTRQTTSGIGPLLYEVLIEYITKEKNAALKPDRSVVSSAAKSVWQKYKERSDIKKVKLDIFSYHAEMDDEIEPLTPDDISDDCIQNSAIADKGKADWSESCLSLGYRKESPTLIKALMKKKLIIMPSKSKKLKMFLISYWNQIKNLF